MTPLIECVVLMVAGLLICFLSASAPLFGWIFKWIGWIVAVCGALLLLARIILFAAEFLKSALGAHG